MLRSALSRPRRPVTAWRRADQRIWKATSAPSRASVKRAEAVSIRRDCDTYSWTLARGRVHNFNVAQIFRASSTLVLLAILAASCGANQKPSAIHATTSTTGNVSVLLEAGGISVTPSNNLHDGQQVKVNLEGFPPGWKVFVSECTTPLEANPLGCGSQLAVQPFTFSNQAGSGSIPFVFHSSAGTSPYSRTPAPCSGECVIVATTGAPVGTHVHGVHYISPITFANG